MIIDAFYNLEAIIDSIVSAPKTPRPERAHLHLSILCLALTTMPIAPVEQKDYG